MEVGLRRNLHGEKGQARSTRQVERTRELIVINWTQECVGGAPEIWTNEETVLKRLNWCCREAFDKCFAGL